MEQKIMSDQIPDGMKRCSKCKEIKPHAAFSRNKKSKDGLKSHCKACINEAYAANPETVRSRSRTYYEANGEVVRSRNRAYHEANRETTRKQQKAYREANSETIRKQSQSYREANAETLRLKKRAY